MPIETIFFDFDGVLAESVNIKTEAFRKMYISRGKEFADRVVAHHLENGGVSRFEKFKLYDGAWLNQTISEEKIEELATSYSSIVLEEVIKCNEVIGTTEFLETVPDIKKYVITGTPTNEIRIILQKRKMEGFFLDAFGSPEKKSTWVQKIIDDNSLDRSKCVFIGDAVADYEAAKGSGIRFILRETPEAQDLFTDFEGIRIKNLSGLKMVLENM